VLAAPSTLMDAKSPSWVIAANRVVFLPRLVGAWPHER
jgi:hypothetical protein